MLLDKATGEYKAYYRNGPHHRAGADVSFNDIMKIFGFRTATVGAWVTPHEQQIAANLFFDALCDLMAILRVPKQVISLKGSLSIAFGSGGQKHASAHYNAVSRTLALAKNAGAGSLSHEWFHAFDHFISTRAFQHVTKQDFASQCWLDNKVLIQHPINQHLASCYQHIFLQQNSAEPSKLFIDSSAADKANKIYYYSRPQEMSARAFEAFVQDQSLKNAFLVKGTKQSVEAKLGIYPQGQQRADVSEAFARYFAALGQAVEP